MNLFLIGSGFTKALLSEIPVYSEQLEKLLKNKHYKNCRLLSKRYGRKDIEIALSKLDIKNVLVKIKLNN